MRRIPAPLLLAVLSVYLALPVACRPTDKPGPSLIEMAKDCTISAGREIASQAIMEVESAIAQATVSGAIAALGSLAVRYGGSFVSCAVDSIVHQSALNLAQAGPGGAPLEATKVINGNAWLTEHPVP